MAYKPNDHYARKARKENFAARSVYKLEEIDRKYPLLRKGDKVLDLGASPGSWSQYAARVVGDKGLVLGIDLKPLTVNIPNHLFIQGDLNEIDWESALPAQGLEPPVDVVLSDMAPQTTGMKVTDQARSAQLCELALFIATRILRPGGHFVCKIFDSGDAQQLRHALRQHFKEVHTLRPKSTRSSSWEFFYIARGFQGGVYEG